MRNKFGVSAKMRSKITLKAAKAYTKAGLKILLTHGVLRDGKCTCGNDDCSKIGKHPLVEFFPKGVKSATSDMPYIERALRKYPKANIAIALEGITVVDTDGPAGEKAAKKLELPKSAFVKTNRGEHTYFVGELDGGSFKCKQLDVLTGANRYVIAPPSKHASGTTYEWGKRSNSYDVPQKLQTLRSSGSAGTQKKVSSKGSGKTISEGTRNDLLFRLASSLRYRGYRDATIEDLVLTANELECDPPLQESEVLKLLKSSNRYTETEEQLFEVVGAAEVLPLEALWYPYIMKHGVTLLVGDPGKGKSLLVAQLIAIVTTGGKWPLSKEKAAKGSVLLLSAEDSFDRVTLARLRKVGADTNRLHRMMKFRALDKEYLEKVVDYARKVRPSLIVIDTLSAYLGSERDMNRQNEVGEFLATLNEVAEEIGCAILGLAHMNKQSNEHPIYRVVGSIGFMASVRSAIFLGSDPNTPENVALAHGKTNGTEEGPTITFEKVGGGRGKIPRLVPRKIIDADASDVCRIERGPVGRPPEVRDAARKRILTRLETGPTKWTTIANDIKNRNITSEGTLNLLRAEMAKSGEIIKIGKGSKTLWQLGEPKKE